MATVSGRRPSSRLRRDLSAIRRLGRELRRVRASCDRRTLAVYATRVVANFPAIVAQRSLGPADTAMSGRQCKARLDGQEFLFDGSAIGLIREIVGRRCYFGASGFGLGRNDIVVDLGANVGVFTVLAARLAKLVVAVEAQAVELDRLRENVDRNGCRSNVVPVLGLVGGRCGVLSSWHDGEFGSRVPPAVTMDELIEEHALDHIDFLKVDVEGSEFDLLQRDAGWLDRVRRAAVEVHTSFGDPAALEIALRDRGFHTHLRDSSGRSVSRIDGPGGYLYAWRA